MIIPDVKVSLVISVLKDCGDIVEALSEASEDYDENTKYENLLEDIDRSIRILKGKE